MMIIAGVIVANTKVDRQTSRETITKDSSTQALFARQASRRNLA